MPAGRSFQILFISAFILFGSVKDGKLFSQENNSDSRWIRPDSKYDDAIWGIKDGIVVGLWPARIEEGKRDRSGGPRGLLRIGYEFKGKVYHLNYIAVEPVVNNQIEFSEISPSHADGQWGKLMWAGTDPDTNEFYPGAITRGVLERPFANKPEVEELSFYVFMEKFLNGAHPYLRVSIRSDKPDEIGIEIFNHEDSKDMDRCVLTATMGNYSRLRNLYLKNDTINSEVLYKGFDDINFIEKKEYPIEDIAKTDDGDFIAIMSPDESFSELASWPQEEKYYEKQNWRYRPFFKVNQYWRKDKSNYDPSLSIRVNGRAYYWSGGSDKKEDYIKIPGGPSFENFEMREDYYPGQKFYFGISTDSVSQIKSR